MTDKAYIRKSMLLFGGPGYDQIARDEFVREMQTISPQIVMPILVDLFSDLDLDIRANAMQAALMVNQELSLGYLLPFFEDRDENIRYHVCGLMEKYGDSRALKPLLSLLRKDVDSSVRGMAAFGLGGVGLMSAIPDLVQTAKLDREVDSLGYTPRQSARQAIHKILRNQVVDYITSSSEKQIEIFYPDKGCLKGQIKNLPSPFDRENLSEDLPRNTFEYTQSWRSKTRSLHSFPILVEVTFNTADIQVGRKYLFESDEEMWAVGIYLSPESDDY